MSTRDANPVTDREVRMSARIAGDFRWQSLVAADCQFDGIEQFLTWLSRNLRPVHWWSGGVARRTRA